MNNSNVTGNITSTLIKTILITAIYEGKSTQPYVLRLYKYKYKITSIKGIKPIPEGPQEVSNVWLGNQTQRGRERETNQLPPQGSKTSPRMGPK